MKVRRIITAVTMAMAIVCLSFGSVNSVEAAEYKNSQINDIDFTLDQLADGVTIVLTRNDDDTFEQTVYYDSDISEIPMPMATADGVLEWATFHLGFNNWNADTGRLYFTVSADEPMSTVTGNAYVKSTSFLFPTSFYSSSFSKSLGGSMNTSRTLKDNVDTGDNTKVRVGFSNVVLKTVAGEYGYFSNTSQVVSR